MGTSSRRPPTIESKTLAATIARLSQDKKAEDVLVVSVDERLGLADYFVFLTGLNRSHVRALANELHVRLKALGERHLPFEGEALAWWVVMDFGDVVVHILQPEARSYYDLDRLYSDCPRLDWQALAPALPDLHAAEA